MVRLAMFGVICFLAVHANAGDLEPPPARQARYLQIKRLIQDTRHFEISAHFVMGFKVNPRDIRAVRPRITRNDIPVLVQMMGDQDAWASAGSRMLLASFGRPAMPALREATQSGNPSIAQHARDTLQLLDDCYNEALRPVMNPDFCPADRAAGAR